MTPRLLIHCWRLFLMLLITISRTEGTERSFFSLLLKLSKKPDGEDMTIVYGVAFHRTLSSKVECLSALMDTTEPISHCRRALQSTKTLSIGKMALKWYYSRRQHHDRAITEQHLCYHEQQHLCYQPTEWID